MNPIRKVSIKIKKSENVHFDGEWVSNGHWMIKKEYVKLQNELQMLINSNTKFSKRIGSLKLGDDANIPNMKDVIESLEDTLPAVKLKIGVDHGSWLIPFVAPDNLVVFIDEKYVPLLELPGSTLHITKNNMVAAKGLNEVILSVVMECQFRREEQLADDAFLLSKLLQPF